jgi:hypothetical protein
MGDHGNRYGRRGYRSRHDFMREIDSYELERKGGWQVGQVIAHFIDLKEKELRKGVI